MIAVPFKVEGLFGGLGECHGLARHTGKLLVLEFQLQDSVVNLVKSDVKGMEIPTADVASIELRSRWFGLVNRLVVQLASMESVKQFPGMKQGRLTLNIARADRKSARALVESVQQQVGR